MLDFLTKVFGFAKPYRTRLVLGVLLGTLGGLVAPLLMATVMFVYGAVFPSENSGVYTMTNNVVVWPAMTLREGATTHFTVSLAQTTNGPTAGKNPKNNALTAAPANIHVLLLGPTNAVGVLSYTVVVTNSGVLTVSNIIVSDNLPTNLVSGNVTVSQASLPIRVMPKFAQVWFANVRASLESGVRSHPWTIVALIAAIPLIMFAKGFFNYLSGYCLQWVSTRAIADMRVKLFRHLLDLSAGFYNENASGQLISRVMNDTGTLQNILSSATSVIVRDPVTLVGMLAFLLWEQPKQTLITLVVLPACMFPIIIVSRKIRRHSRELQSQAAELTQTMTEAFTGHRIVKAYNLEPIVAGQFLNVARRSVSLYMRIVRAGTLPGPLIEFFGSCGVALLLAFLIYQPLGHPNPTDFLQLIGSVFFMYQPMKNLVQLQNQIVQARAATERVFEILATKNSVPEPAAPKMLHADHADIIFENVDFNYGEKPVLRNINLHVKAGQMIAFVGATGSGKTTLTNLLLRFYDPARGAIRIGGVDLRDVRTQDLRNQIAVVTQETILFNDTVRRNIELGRPGASNDEIEAAARFAKADEFIMQRPGRYDSEIGEKGANLSGGQRQRIAIARAILKNAPILILDEATSALDSEVEKAVQNELDALMKNRTTFCIAHRLSTIFRADMIVVLDQGRIVETGRHEELVQRGGVYQKLYELQFAS